MPEPTMAELLDPAVLARIDNYALLARTVVEGIISGLHHSLFHGFGSEFFQYRDYVPGDDFKYVDWKVFARHNRLTTKIFQEETNMNCCLVLDTSASMGYQSHRAPCSKLRYACMVAACFAYLASRQGDQVGLYAYGSDLVEAIKPGPRSGGQARIMTALHSLTAVGSAQHRTFLERIAASLRTRGTVILFSDLLDAESDLGALLKRIRFAHHECIVFQILDPEELDFSFSGTRRFVDRETGGEIVTAPELVRNSYRERMKTFLDQVRLACLEQQVDYLQVATSDNLGNTLAAYLHRREAMV